MQIENEPTASTQDFGPGLQYLTFSLGDEVFAMDIRCVREIIQHGPLTIMPMTPDFVRGVINLRGIIIPVVDMRIKFALGEPVYDQFTVVIILKLKGAVTGAVVDAVGPEQQEARLGVFGAAR